MFEAPNPKPPASQASSPRNRGKKPPSRKRRWLRLRTWRRITQIAFLLLFVYILLGGHGAPTLEGWENAGPISPDVIFLSDPFTWGSAAIAAREIIAKVPLLLLIFVALTLVFGRVFCGWVCPLGTLIDGSAKVLRPGRRELKAGRLRRERRDAASHPSILNGRTKYYILVSAVVLALFGVNVAGWVDPLAILMRGTAFALMPAAAWGVEESLGRLAYAPVASGPASSAYYWVRENALGPVPHSYHQAFLHLGILLGVLALTRIRRRYWCHVFCPLGALYGLLARTALWKRRVDADSCNECAVCGFTCRMEAVAEGSAATLDPSECLRCAECADLCPSQSVEFTFPSLALSSSTPDAVSRPERLHLTRRGLLGAIGASAVAVPLLRLTSSAGASAEAGNSLTRLDAYLIRPPGAREESEFLQLCIRCGECYKVCPQNALHPTLLQAGLEGIWTPLVVSRIGYCEPTCTLCTQICPTTALQP